MKNKLFQITLSLVLFLIGTTTILAQGCVDDGGSDDGVQVKGYIQPQYLYNFNGTDSDGKSLDENNFNIERARIGVVGSVPYDFKYYFFAELSPFKDNATGVRLLDAFITYTRFSKYANISVGQFKAPIGLEQNTGCSALSTLYRSPVTEQLAGPQRDLGILFTAGNDTTFVKYALGFMNGAGKNMLDNNKGKDIVGRLIVQPTDFIDVGGSFRMGTRNPTDLTQKQNNITRLAGEITVEYSGFKLQAEYLYGIDKLYSTTKIPIYGGCGGIVGFVTKPEGTYKKGGYWVIASYKTLIPQVSSTTKPNCTPLLGMLKKTYSP